MDFYKVFKSFSNDERLNFSDILVLSVLVTHAQFTEDQTVELSFNEINAEFKRLNRLTIIRCLQRLAELEYIESIKEKGKKNKYRVLIDVPKAQAQSDKPKHKKNKLESDDNYMQEVQEAMNANRFLLNKGE